MRLSCPPLLLLLAPLGALGLVPPPRTIPGIECGPDCGQPTEEPYATCFSHSDCGSGLFCANVCFEGPCEPYPSGLVLHTSSSGTCQPCCRCSVAQEDSFDSQTCGECTPLEDPGDYDICPPEIDGCRANICNVVTCCDIVTSPVDPVSGYPGGCPAASNSCCPDRLDCTLQCDAAKAGDPAAPALAACTDNSELIMGGPQPCDGPNPALVQACPSLASPPNSGPPTLECCDGSPILCPDRTQVDLNGMGPPCGGSLDFQAYICDDFTNVLDVLQGVPCTKSAGPHGRSARWGWRSTA